MTDRQYPHPRPRLLTVRLALMAVPFAAGVLTAGLRTAAGEHLIAYWGWIESVAAAIVIEGGELAFLLRWIHARNDERDDWVAAVGMILGMTVSVAFSTLLALSNGEHIAPSVRTFGQAVVVVASIGINVLTFLSSRGLAATIVEHESAVADWERKRAEWANRRADRAERKADGERTDADASVHPADKAALMLDCYRTQPDITVRELCATFNRRRTWVYELRTKLLADGKLVKDGKGYRVA